MDDTTSNIHIRSTNPLPTPDELMAKTPASNRQLEFVKRTREDIRNAIFADNERFVLIVGPCSIHDTSAGLEFAQRLSELSERVKTRIQLVMRVYFEKPRTSLGWKGLIMDPHLNGSEDIACGLGTARKFLSQVLDLGIPTATELLDPITPQYIADLVCWAAIGARTTESQTHRQMASGLSMPVGFKNGMDGTVQVAINAIRAASGSQTFLGINHQGLASAVATSGNPSCHVVLRGGTAGPNYDEQSIEKTTSQLRQAGLSAGIMVDCSHGNSNKHHERQPQVLAEVMRQVSAGNKAIIGAMLESNLNAGSQPFPSDQASLKYGVSITDGCIDWQSTETAVMDAFASLAPRFDHCSHSSTKGIQSSESKTT